MTAVSELLDMSMEIQLEGRELPNMDFGSLSDPFAVIDVRMQGEWVEFGTFASSVVDIAHFTLFNIIMGR